LKKLEFKVNEINELVKWRVNTFWNKEPETIEFINAFRNYHPDTHRSVFLDIGANIGLYSLYAASLFPHMIIVAIEPEINNYTALVNNIKLNNYGNIFPLNFAIDSVNKICDFGHTIGAKIIAGNSKCAIINHNHITNYNTRDIIAINIDTICNMFHHIDFIKIDIDGGEFDAVGGMLNTIGSIRAMLIEIDKNDTRSDIAIKYIIDNGYTIDNYFNRLSNHSRFRREKEGIEYIENIVFTKR
jgi:FkbM family methyltransferase